MKQLIVESVWDYPRPPVVESVGAELRVEFGGRTIAKSVHGHRVLETSHPPVYYIPLVDVDHESLVVSDTAGPYCEWKGQAEYWSIRVGDRTAIDAAWGYPNPTRPFAAIRNHIAFYAGRVDGCYVDRERVTPQPGGFYGGWITRGVAGPFKGGPGTNLW